MRLLIIEDELLIGQGIRSVCSSEGFVCQIACTGEEAIELVTLYDYDCVILDLVLPDMNGFDLLGRVRLLKRNAPIIVLSGLASVDDKVKCLSNGADDFLTKPFSKTELLARIYAIIRRTNGVHSSLVEIGPLSLEFNQRIVKIYGTELPLTCKEYAILELMTIRRGSIITKETFLNHIYGGMDEPDMKIVDVFICKLRKKMADMSGGINFIETVWGRGYTIRENYPELDCKNPTPSLKVS